MNMAHTDKLKKIFTESGLTYTEIAKSLGLVSSTVKKKFESDNINTVIDFIQALGLHIVNNKGVDVITNEPFIIEVGNLRFTAEEFEDLKNKLKE